ncbi:unnamed protein product [Alternaria alternata]
MVDAETLTDQFAKITIGNAAIRYASGDLRRYGADTLSKVEHRRILHAFLRLQLYIEIRKLYGVRRSSKRKLRGLFSLWTTWEFDEVRSLVEWIKIERPSLPKHYAKRIRKLFALVDAHFYNDMALVEPTRVMKTGDLWDIHPDVMLSTLNAYTENTSSPEVTHSGLASLPQGMSGGMNTI